MIFHLLAILKLVNFSLPANKGSKVVIVNQKVEYCLGFGEMNILRYFCSKRGLELGIIFFLN